ncbi:MAG: GNAT family N-acetyltransferase [Candidatus Didemnitutus sp.]|nr:GNAT family N-acetyltransferase [Candidatus Didemnitutus sp.]
MALETPRLSLRRFAPIDAAFVVALLTSPDWLRFIGDRGVRTETDALVYIERLEVQGYARNGFGLYHVSRRSDGKPVGMCGLLRRDTTPDVEIGFAFLAEHAGQGYATEAGGAVLGEAREQHGLRRIGAVVMPENRASIRVLEKLGLRFERPIVTDPAREPLQYFARALDPES